MDRWILLVVCLLLLVSFGYTFVALGAGRFRPGTINLTTVGGAFALLSIFLYWRGQEVQACPLYSLSDLLVFLGWSIALIYLLIGPAYRLSLMGAFTAPLILVLVLVGLAVMPEEVARRSGPPDAWVELHASLSVVAYGAFGLAAVAGAMYLVQERQLKRHQVSRLFYNLPPIQDLSTATGRLIVLGFSLLTVAFLAGFISRLPVEGLKIWASLIIWALYGMLVWRRSRHQLSPRHQACWALGFFLFIIITLPGVHYLSSPEISLP
jgi:ABC-type uncharacterized transport system permease subunit